MSLNAKKVKQAGGKGSSQEPIEPGTYPCRLVQVLDMGLQSQRPYKGEEKPPAHEINLTYEFLDEFCKDKEGNDDPEKPRWLSESMPLRNLEQDLAKSTKRYNAIDPKCVHDGDFTELVGSCCMVTIAQRAVGDKVYTNITNVASMRSKEADRAPELVNPAKVFLLDEPDLEVLGSLPDWIQEKIKSNLEFAGSVLDKALNGDAPEDKQEAKQPEADDEGGEW